MTGSTDAGYGAVLHFSCGRGYIMHGAAARRCQQYGVWSGKPTSCRRESHRADLEFIIGRSRTFISRYRWRHNMAPRSKMFFVVTGRLEEGRPPGRQAPPPPPPNKNTPMSLDALSLPLYAIYSYICTRLEHQQYLMSRSWLLFNAHTVWVQTGD